jgi:RHS repeat-associated protein
MNQYSTTPFGARTNDANGNLTVAASEYFIYDYRNELIASYHYTGTGFNQTFAAKYDCFGRRIEKVTPLGTTRFYYQVSPGQGHENWAVAPGQGQNHYQEIEEQDDTDATVATYVWGNGIDELLTTDRNGQRYFFHADDLGSIRKVTDDTGAVVEQYRYDDYGLPTFLNAAGTVLPSSQITNATLFTGRRYDPETGLYYYRTRYLDPRAGRFTTRDTIGIWTDPDDLGNGYAYVGNNPASYDWTQILNPRMNSDWTQILNPYTPGVTWTYTVSANPSLAGMIRYTVSASPTLAGPGNSTDFTANGPIVALLRNISTGPGDIRFASAVVLLGSGIIIMHDGVEDFTASDSSGRTRESPTLASTGNGGVVTNVKHSPHKLVISGGSGPTRPGGPGPTNPGDPRPVPQGPLGEMMLSIQAGGSSGGERMSISTTRSNIKHQNDIAIKQPGIKFTDYAGIAITQPGIK